jgi:nicotinamidase-related amidase
MLYQENCVLIVVDAQGNLARVVAESEAAISRIQTLIKAADVLKLPVLLTAQSPHKIGHTIPEVASLLPARKNCPGQVLAFWRMRAAAGLWESMGRRQALLAASKRTFACTRARQTCWRPGMKFMLLPTLFLPQAGG